MRNLLDPELCTAGPHPIEHNRSSNWTSCSNPPLMQGLKVGKFLTTSTTDSNCESS